MPASAPSDLTAYADAAATACGLPLDGPMRAGILANLERTRAFASLLETAPELADTEPAPVFAPEAP
jgi:hypothetical protein